MNNILVRIVGLGSRACDFVFSFSVLYVVDYSPDFVGKRGEHRLVRSYHSVFVTVVRRCGLLLLEALRFLVMEFINAGRSSDVLRPLRNHHQDRASRS